MNKHMNKHINLQGVDTFAIPIYKRMNPLCKLGVIWCSNTCTMTPSAQRQLHVHLLAQVRVTNDDPGSVSKPYPEDRPIALATLRHKNMRTHVPELWQVAKDWSVSWTCGPSDAAMR
jgi:hypothetical protein